MKTELHLPSELPTGWERTGAEGLTSQEVPKRKANILPRDDGKSTAQIITENVFTLFNGLNLLLAAALMMVGSYRNMLFLMVVIFNTGIAIFQEIRARNTIRKLKLLHAPQVHVNRDGREITIGPEEAVEGDLMILRGGDQIVADCIALSGGGRAMESLLTGESNDIPKGEGDWLYSGSYLTEGKMICQVVYVGQESYAGRLTREAKRRRKAESGLMKEMKRLIRWDSMALIPMGVLLFLKQTLWRKLPIAAAVPSTVAAMIGMIPEGLMLLTSMAMAVGIIRLAKRKTLVQELYGIESLARVDVLCLDKTGTLTSGNMQVEELIPAEGADEEGFRQAMARFLGAFDERSGTLQALREAVTPGMEEAIAIQPFSSKRKKSAASFADGKTLALGAAEYVLGEEIPEALQALIREATQQGKRVLILAEGDGEIQGEKLPPMTKTWGICCLADEVRPHARETTEYFRQQGVELKVISGDDPETVSRIAGTAGIAGSKKWIDARELDTEEKIAAACEEYTVFGRVTPEQKKKLVEALQAKGHTVGMTGDGVNDIPALRAADCSIAMEAGADAARHTAQLTLMENDFGAVPEIVMEGRRVINNITRSATLFLTKTIFSFLLGILTLASPGAYPFQPIQLSLVSGWTVGIPGFFLAMERSKERIQGDFIRNVFRKALPGGAAVAICATGAMLLTHIGWSAETCSTLSTWIAGLMGVVVLIRACWPLNLARGIIAGGALGMFVICATMMEKVFFMVDLKGVEWVVLAALFALGVGIYLAVKHVMDRKRN